MTTSLTQSSAPVRDRAGVWLRGLLTVAWADGDFSDDEQEAIAALTQDELAPGTDFSSFDPVTPEELADAFPEAAAAENFMRTAVMVAIADGVYSKTEANLLEAFATAFDLDLKVLDSLKHTMCESETGAPLGAAVQPDAANSRLPGDHPHPHSDILHPVKDWLDDIEVHDPQVARFVCKLIPPNCPFERDVKVFGRKLVHIPPLCKLNPIYEQLVGLRFRALSYLADDCGEDVTPYLQ